MAICVVAVEICWTALAKQYNIGKLNGAQRAVCVGVVGTIKCIYMCQLPIDICIRNLTENSAM